MSKVSQRLVIFRHLQTFGSITSWEAIKEYGITRLSAVIFDLRQNGIDIPDRWIIFTNRFGEQGRYKEYLYKSKKK